MKLIDHVRPPARVHFEFYREGELWYKTDSGFSFPVPIADAGTACFLKNDKAILFMRYVRKHMDVLAKESTPNGST